MGQDPVWRFATRSPSKSCSRTTSAPLGAGEGLGGTARSLGAVDDGSVRPDIWESIASLVGELIVSKSQYGDHITLRRRRTEFSLAAEMRWGLLPPLTFTSPDVTIAGFLQPCDGIAGDAFDYGVTGRIASLAIFDAMGHGIEASRMANVAVGCYRNARRAGADLVAALLVHRRRHYVAVW